MNNNATEKFIGMDISNAKIDVAQWGNKETWEFGNDGRGLQRLVQQMK